MYGLFTYIWLIFMVNVGKYTIHGLYGYFFGGWFGIGCNVALIGKTQTNRQTEQKEL